jgi:hypothetical protein
MIYLLIINNMQFNRRQNRIAGPGFHLNVRYDDQTMATAMNGGNKVAPVLSAGLTTVENFDIKEQELLVCKAQSNMYHDGYTHVFSFCNGLENTDGANNDEIEENILSQVRYIGVATTEYKPSKAYSEQGSVCQVGGVSTLINESSDVIKPGDILQLGVNLKANRRTTREKGIPREKIRFTVKKAAVGDAMLKVAMAKSGKCNPPDPTKLTQLKAAAKAAKGPAAKTAAEQDVKDYLATCNGAANFNDVKSIFSKYAELNSRIIGRSCSYARPGDRLEVILQPRNPH